ncbi:MAG: hypothetical protein AABX29_04175 [Nanoarchaeota archaeon]
MERRDLYGGPAIWGSGGSTERTKPQDIPSLQFVQGLIKYQAVIDAQIDALYPMPDMESVQHKGALQNLARIFRRQETDINDADGVSRGNKRVTIISIASNPMFQERYHAFIDYETGNPIGVVAGLVLEEEQPRDAYISPIESLRLHIDHLVEETERGLLNVMLIDRNPIRLKEFKTLFRVSIVEAQKELVKEKIKVLASKRLKKKQQKEFDDDSIQSAFIEAMDIFDEPSEEPTTTASSTPLDEPIT